MFSYIPAELIVETIYIITSICETKMIYMKTKRTLARREEFLGQRLEQPRQKLSQIGKGRAC